MNKHDRLGKINDRIHHIKGQIQGLEDALTDLTWEKEELEEEIAKEQAEEENKK